jgi:hypothetical protein
MKIVLSSNQATCNDHCISTPKSSTSSAKIRTPRDSHEIANGAVDLVRDGAELQLSGHSGDGVFGSVNRVFVDDVDERYATFRPCGLDTTRVLSLQFTPPRRSDPGDCASL